MVPLRRPPLMTWQCPLQGTAPVLQRRSVQGVTRIIPQGDSCCFPGTFFKFLTALCAMKSARSESRNFCERKEMSHQGAFGEYSGESFIWRERGNRGRRWPAIGESVSGLRQDDPMQYMHRWEAGSRGKTAQGWVHPSFPWQSAGPSRCYGGWQATIAALAMWLTARQAGIDPQRCFILTTNALDATLSCTRLRRLCMMRKESWDLLLVYNLLPTAMAQAALGHGPVFLTFPTLSGVYVAHLEMNRSVP
jgi:hypothetical protein